jgi:hypothetical protein
MQLQLPAAAAASASAAMAMQADLFGVLPPRQRVMNRWSLLWAFTVLAVLFGGPTGAAGRRLDADTAWPAAAGVEPVSLSVLPELQPATAEVQNAPLLQAAAPARANTLSSMSFGKGPTAAPPREADATRTFSRIVTQLPAGSSLMTAGDLEAQFTGTKRPQVFGGRSTDFKAQANGVGGIPYSDSRFTADYYTLGKTRVGKLYMSFGRRWWVCSASVINRALLVTAAHCVCEWGQGQNCFPDKDADDNLLVSVECNNALIKPDRHYQADIPGAEGMQAV